MKSLKISARTGPIVRSLEPLYDPAAGPGHMAGGIVFLVLLAVSLAFYAGTSSVIVDDAFVYFRSIENFLAHGDASFNVGDSRDLMTSPGWFVALASAKFLLPAFELPLLAKALSTILLGVASVLLYAALRDRIPALAPLSPLPVFFAPSIPQFAGHDTALALAANLFVIWAFLERRLALLPVAGALAYLVRGESAVFAAILIALAFTRDGIRHDALTGKLRSAVVGIVAAGLLLALWHGFHFMAFDSFLPDTLSAKRLQMESHYFPAFRTESGYHLNAVTAPLGKLPHLATLFGLALVARAAWPLAAWPFVHFLVLTAVNVPWYTWYYYPVEFGAVLGLVAFAVAASFIAHDLLRKTTFPATAGVAGLLLLAGILFTAISPLRNAIEVVAWPVEGEAAAGRTHRGVLGADKRYDFYRRFAAVMTNARSGSGAPLLLAHEIGIIGYFAPELRVYDMVGLATPTREPERIWDTRYHVEQYRPDFIMIPANTPPEPDLTFRLTSGEELSYRLIDSDIYPGTKTSAALYARDRADLGKPR